jgi:hypothetical protein
LRVLRPRGTLMLGRTVTPDDGVDARMKRQLAAILGEPVAGKPNTRAAVELYLEETARATAEIDAAQWNVTRTPRDFIDRHSGGARFSKLSPDLRARSLSQLADWAADTFGGLDAGFTETHRFTLRTFTFAER